MNTSRFFTSLTAAALAAAVAAPATSAPADRDGTLLKWHGKERTAQLPVGAEAIPGAPHSFRTFAREELRDSWIHDLGHRPACKEAPTMSVRSLRTDGFAFGTSGTYPQPGCATGGGYVAYWAIRHGEWKEVIGTQDIPFCDKLEKFGFPSELGIHQCFDGQDVVSYTHA